jgi:hypothetical protein
LVVALGLAGCGSDGGSSGGSDTGGSGGEAGTGGAFEPPAFNEWIKYEPEGAVCSDGSPYKFWVKFSETSENLIIFLEGGGACWDYESCSGATGIRGAANRNGLRDDYATAHREEAGLVFDVDAVYPLLNTDPEVSPMADWNKVFVPYCTGDIYSGDRVAIYENPNEGEPDLEYRHVGHLNMLAMIDMIDGMFDRVPKMFVGGCSAGGVGALSNYYFLRTGIQGVEKGYLLDDSGPVFPSNEPTSRSGPLYDTIRDSWGLDALIDSVPQAAVLREDFGQLSAVLADEFPDDRLALTVFRMDYSFSLYSYERFYTRYIDEIVLYEGPGLGLDQYNWLDRNAVHTLFWDDIDLFTSLAETKPNFGYFIPFYRETNNSHCVTVPGLEELPLEDALTLYLTDFGSLAWLGSEIGDTNIHDFVDALLDDEVPIHSAFEGESEGHYAACAPGNGYSEAACRDAVCERLSPKRRIEQGCPETPSR